MFLEGVAGDRRTLTENGKARFEEVKVNDYKINIVKDENVIGVINIAIKTIK